jgi:hypothetical protein
MILLRCDVPPVVPDCTSASEAGLGGFLVARSIREA